MYIQDLRNGDLVKTLNHGFLPIEFLGKREMYHQGCKERIKDQLYCCSKDNCNFSLTLSSNTFLIAWSILAFFVFSLV